MEALTDQPRYHPLSSTVQQQEGAYGRTLKSEFAPFSRHIGALRVLNLSSSLLHCPTGISTKDAAVELVKHLLRIPQSVIEEKRAFILQNLHKRIEVFPERRGSSADFPDRLINAMLGADTMGALSPFGNPGTFGL